MNFDDLIVVPQLRGRDLDDLVSRGLARVKDGYLVPVFRGADPETDDDDAGEKRQVELTPEVRRILDGIKGTWDADFKKVAEQLEREEKARGDATGETKQAFERVSDRLDQLEARFDKAAGEQRRDETREASAERKAYEQWLARGRGGEEMKLLVRTDGEGNVVEQRAMAISDDTEGGYLAPDDVVSEIIQGIVEYSPLRSICRVRTTVRRSVKAPKRTQTASATWVGETETRNETTNPKVGQEEIQTGELSAMADISRQDLEDSGYDLEAWVYGEFGEQFGVAEGTAFVNGDGIKGKPEGFLQATDQGAYGANGIETKQSGTNDALAADDFIDLYFLLKDGYARNGTWVMKRSTIRDARKLKDAVNGNYLWQPGLAGVAPATILDRPYVEAIDMPAVANGAMSVAFGDFKRGYWIVDRLMIETLRDPYTQAGSGNIRLWARKRVGGQVVNPEAIKVLRIQ